MIGILWGQGLVDLEKPVEHYVSELKGTAYEGALLWQVWSAPGLKGLARAILVLVLLQFATGMSNVVLQWPLLLAVAHSGGAALLVALLVVVTYRLRSGR